MAAVVRKSAAAVPAVAVIIPMQFLAIAFFRRGARRAVAEMGATSLAGAAAV